jgi:shikimate dehydrogenase
MNVTIPHKEKVMPYLDEIDKEAQFIGAVNTIVYREEEGNLIGYNTDGRGFLQSLSEQDVSISGKDVLVIGAGGAARAVSYYICQQAKTLALFGRTKERVHALVNDLNSVNSNVYHLHDIKEIKKYHLIIHATPLGMKENDPLPLDADLLSKNQIVCDLIYRKTKLLFESEKKGCATIDGSGMLLWQGVFAFELWTGKKPDVDVMRKALEMNR